jgi:hypothetical protein
MAKFKGDCPMTRELLMTAAIVAITLAPSIGVGTAAADGKGIHGGGIHGGGLHHRGFFAERGLRGSGLGYGGFIAYTDPGATAEAPSIFAVPPPAPAVLAADLPPCRETTTDGVVIARGTSCSHGAP